MSAPTWKEEFKQPDRSYSISDIEECFEYILKNIEKVNYNNKPSIKTYINIMENRITFKIKTGYYLELLSPETLATTKSEIIKNKNVPHLEIAEVVLVNCNIVNNDYQQDSRVL